MSGGKDPPEGRLGFVVETQGRACALCVQVRPWLECEHCTLMYSGCGSMLVIPARSDNGSRLELPPTETKDQAQRGDLTLGH